MTDFKKTTGDGYNVFLSADRLFIVEVATGTRRADLNVDEKLLATLREALATNETPRERQASQRDAPPKAVLKASSTPESTARKRETSAGTSRPRKKTTKEVE